MTHVNGTSVDDTSIGPFGGEKNSGIEGSVGVDTGRAHDYPLDKRAAWSRSVPVLMELDGEFHFR